MNADIKLYKNDLPDLDFSNIDTLAIDCEMTGLNITRDRLCTIQISTGKNDALIVQFDRKNYNSPNLINLLKNNDVKKIFHYARMDLLFLRKYLNVRVENVLDTKIASKLCRTYTQNHGLKDLVLEFCGKKLDKRLGSSDWNKKLDELTDAQLQYCSNDVIYLHKIKNELHKMLVRENRLELYENSINFLKTRIKLDQSGFTEDIFAH